MEFTRAVHYDVQKLIDCGEEGWQIITVFSSSNKGEATDVYRNLIGETAHAALVEVTEVPIMATYGTKS